MKNLILTLMIVGFLVGCGGGGGSSDNNDRKNESDNKEKNLNGVKYPESFRSIDNFPLSTFFVKDRSADILFLPIITRNINGQGLNIIELAEKSNLRRSHCEKGSTGETGLVYNNDMNSPSYQSGSGSFNFRTSSGVSYESIQFPDKSCIYSDFFHGYISYDIQTEYDTNKNYEISSNITATLGTSSEAFLINLEGDGYLDGSIGYSGSFVSTTNKNTIEISAPYMEVFKVITDISEPYQIGAFDKRDNTYFKNYIFKSKTVGDGVNKSIEISTSYQANFSYQSQDFILFYKDIQTRKGKKLSFSTEYELQIPNDLSKTVKATVNLNGGEMIITFTKDGQTEKKVI